MTVDWHVSDVPPSTYREGIARTNSIASINSIASTHSTESVNSADSTHSIDSTDSTDHTDSAGVSLRSEVIQVKYLRGLRHGQVSQVWKAKAKR